MIERPRRGQLAARGRFLRALGLAGLLAAAWTATPASAGPLVFHETPRAVPALEFVDEAGNPRALAEWRGRVVVLNVWATWCAPCREEMPTLDRLQADLGGDDFQVLALSIDHAGASAVRRFYDEMGIRRLAVFVDPSGSAVTRLGIFGLPGTLVLDRQGLEVARLIGQAEWDTPEMMARFRTLIGAPAGDP